MLARCSMALMLLSLAACTIEVRSLEEEETAAAVEASAPRRAMNGEAATVLEVEEPVETTPGSSDEGASPGRRSSRYPR